MGCDSAIVNFTLHWNDDNSTSKYVLSIDSYNHDTREDTPNHKWIMLQKIWKGPKGQMQRRKTNYHTTWIYIYMYNLYTHYPWLCLQVRTDPTSVDGGSA